MSVVVSCPKCAAKLRGPTELAGKTVRCKACREKFRIPGGDPAADSVGDTQQLSVMESKFAVPAVAIPAAPAPAAFVPQPLFPLPAPAGTADDPLPLDELDLVEVPKLAAMPVPKPDLLDVSDLVLEDAPKPPAPFSFDEPAPPEPKKKKKPRDEDDDAEDDRPRKRKKRDDDDEDDDRPKKKRKDDDEQPEEKKGYQARKAGTPWGMLIGVLVVLLALGGGLAAMFLMGDKKKDETAKTEPPDAKAKQPKGKGKGDPKTPQPNPIDPNPNPMPPTDPNPKPPVDPNPMPKDPPKTNPPKKNPPVNPPVEVKLPDPPAGELALVGKPKVKFTADIPPEKLKHVGVGGERVIVAFNSKPGFQGVGVTDVIRQYNLNGTKGREFEIDSGNLAWPRPIAVGTTDQLVAVAVGGPANVTAYDFDSGNLLFNKLNVFDGADGRVGPIAALALGANRKLFVVDQAGTVDVWDMGTRQRTVTGTPAKRTAPGKPVVKACAFHNGAAVAVALDGRITVTDANGQPLGKGMPLPDPTATLLAMGAGAGADRLAVAYSLPGGKVGVAAIHPIENSIALKVVLPDGSGAPSEVAWVADTLLTVTLANGSAALLIDVETKQPTGYLKATTGKATLYPAAGAVWWLTEDAGKPALVSVGMPFDEYFDLRKMIGEDRRPLFLVPRPDGLAK